MAMKLLSNEKNHNRWRKGIRWNPILFYDVLLIRLSPRSRSSHKRSSIVSVNSISFYQEKNVRLFLFIKKYLDSTITHFLRFTTFIRTFRRENCLRSSGPWPPSTWRCSELKLFAWKKKKRKKISKHSAHTSFATKGFNAMSTFLYISCRLSVYSRPLSPLSLIQPRAHGILKEKLERGKNWR